MPRLLFVCLGNICRSSAAEEIMRVRAAAAGLEVGCDSAGLIDYHEGELSDPRMRRCAASRGYRLTHRSRPFRRSDFDAFDCIIAMDDSIERSLLNQARTAKDEEKILHVRELLPHSRAAFVPDPYYGDAAAFEYAVDLIEEACDELIARIKEKG
ncbi:MAG: low molecular weight phosphotyrosine protein phosphatase [Alloprevotella sp.]|nr:low molecular weight phosphotyrosine protein phosphatase [Alloprevotella sp.]